MTNRHRSDAKSKTPRTSREALKVRALVALAAEDAPVRLNELVHAVGSTNETSLKLALRELTAEGLVASDLVEKRTKPNWVSPNGQPYKVTVYSLATAPAPAPAENGGGS